MTEHIKVVYHDSDPIVYRDDKVLNEKEIVDLLVEFFEDCDTLINEKEQLKKENANYKSACEKYNIQPEHLEKVLDDFNEFLNDEYKGYLNGESYCEEE